MPVSPADVVRLSAEDRKQIEQTVKAFDAMIVAQGKERPSDRLWFTLPFSSRLSSRVREEVRAAYEAAGWEAEIQYSRHTNDVALALKPRAPADEGNGDGV